MSIATSKISGSDDAMRKIRVMIVDDSVVIRGLVSRWLEEDGFEVVARAKTGAEAVAEVAHAKPDIVLLDIEMPEMDGITALPRLLEIVPGLPVIMVSSLTQRSADISLKALERGAIDYVPKPVGDGGAITSMAFRRELSEKVGVLGAVVVNARHADQQQVSDITSTGLANYVVGKPIDPEPVKFQPLQKVKPSILAIASSTGGPNAIRELMTLKLTDAMHHVPTVIVQHMPKSFTTVFAQNIAKQSHMPVTEGEHGEIIKPGHIYVAPGGKHMVLEGTAERARIVLNDDAPLKFCKPAADPMFESIADIYGSAGLGVVLTGMGEDGVAGSEAIVGRGGNILIQDEASSVVWGMPGRVANRGLAAEMHPLDMLGPRIASIIRGQF